MLIFGNFSCFFLTLLIFGFPKCDNNEDILSNEFHTELHEPLTDDEARSLAEELGLKFLRRHLYSPNEFVFEHPKVPRLQQRNRTIAGDPAAPAVHQLNQHPRVRRAVQAAAFPRSKRHFRRPIRRRSLTTSSERMNKKGLAGREYRHPSADFPEPTDPLYTKEWYIKNVGQAGGKVGLDLNVLDAWAQGVTGRGVTTAIMDDGIDYLHADIAPNFNLESSYDFSSNDPFPYPRYTDDWFNSHGTRCAGEISAVRDNGVCGVGVAYGSRVAGLRMLDQPFMTDLIEAAAMSHDRQRIHIYSASWGPTDDGKTVDGPRNQTLRAIVEGINRGRGGLGSIFVWASGDGGAADDCNCDGYAASMWTISINSATNDGQRASYDESCSSTLASTFSNGKMWYSVDAGVGTVDLYGNCTLHHSGTSAAAPEAAGVFALALEANSKLTWRDLQHLIVLTSKRNHLHDHTGKHNWTMNGAGLEFNHLFGFGVLDAGDLVRMARAWSALPERYHCVAGEVTQPHHFNVTNGLRLDFQTDGCAGSSHDQVSYLEHVQIFVSVRASRRGDLTMFLTSPMGTTSMLLGRRPKDDDSQRGFRKWPFMSTHMWAESPRGQWTLRVVFFTEDPLAQGLLSDVKLVLHGTQQAPYDGLSADISRRVRKLATVKRVHAGEGISPAA